MELRDRVWFALDVNSWAEVERFITMLGPLITTFKIGFRLYLSRDGRLVMQDCIDWGGKIFLDLKLHDIPATVGDASAEIAGMGVDYFSVHASAGVPAMRAALENRGGAKVLAVTLLTSLEEESEKIYAAAAPQAVFRLANLAVEAKADDIICSGADLPFLNAASEELAAVCKYCPGIRSADKDANDQQRTATPFGAFRNGATAIIVGRQVRDAKNPLDEMKRILDEASNGLEARKKERM